MFNVKNYPNAEGKNYGRHPAKLHYIECGYKRRGFTMISYPLRSGPSLRRWTSTLLRLKSVFIRVQLNLDHNSTEMTAGREGTEALRRCRERRVASAQFMDIINRNR